VLIRRNASLRQSLRVGAESDPVPPLIGHQATDTQDTNKN
jgi:hypothetical protein